MAKNIDAADIKDNVFAAQILEHFCILPNKAKKYNCLWHDDSTKSMAIIPRNPRLAHCFGCGKTADVIGIYMILSGKSFNESLVEMNDIFMLGSIPNTKKCYTKKDFEFRQHDKELDRKIFLILCDLEKAYGRRISRARYASEVFELSRVQNKISYALDLLTEVD